MKTLIDRLHTTHHLSTEDYRRLLSSNDLDAVEHLHQLAQQVAVERFGHGIFVRGLIEVTNVCRNDCLYCGIRRSNAAVQRYTLTQQQILECCRKGYELGFRTFVLQGGELPREHAEWVAGVVTAIHDRWPECAITLSLGEWPREVYDLWHQCGATRYLLRHETHNADHYALLHPAEMKRDQRLLCLDWLKELGYQVGTGIMVGSPGQTTTHLLEDIMYIEQFKPHMIGLGPFIPQHDTPMGIHPHGSIDLTLRLYSIFRLMFPDVLIPSTTALNTIHPKGRLLGIQAGANVTMPNLSPADHRSLYALYDGKTNQGAEAAEGVQQLQQELLTIGYHIDWSRGDAPKKQNLN